MNDDTSWLEEGRFSTPGQAAPRLNITDDTVRRWARAGVIRHIADGTPTRFLLCDDDIDELAELLQGVRHPTLALIRVFMEARRAAQ